MKKISSVIKRYENEVSNLMAAKTEEDKLFSTGVICGIRTGVFLSTDMSVKEYMELIELGDTGMIRRECTLCFDKTFENSDGCQVSCHHNGYEVHFANDFCGDYRNWWNEYEDNDGNIYYGR